MATDAIFNYKDDHKVDFNHRDSIHKFEQFGSFSHDTGRKRTWKKANMSYYRRDGPAAKVINDGAGASGTQVQNSNPKVSPLETVLIKFLESSFWC